MVTGYADVVWLAKFPSLPPRPDDDDDDDYNDDDDDDDNNNNNKLLRIILQSNLKNGSRVQYLLAQCSQRLYLLKLLRHQGMPVVQLATVACAIIVSRILYALPSWGGFLSTDLTNRIDVFFRRFRRFWLY